MANALEDWSCEMIDFQIRLLTYFLAVVKEQSFSKAAAKLGISQPSLSQRIQTLEEHCGISLLDRSGRHVLPTQDGQRLLEPFRELVARGDGIAALARDLREGDNRPVQLGVTMYSDTPERANLINDFLTANPETHLHLETTYTVDLDLALLGGRYDLSFYIGPPPRPNLEYLVVHHSRVELLIPSSSSLRELSEIPLIELVGRSIVTFERFRFPELFDAVLQPLERAGAVFAYPTDQTPMGQLTHGRLNQQIVAMPLPFLTDEALTASGFVRRPIRDFDPPVALMLLRPRAAVNRVGASLWNYTRSWTGGRFGTAA